MESCDLQNRHLRSYQCQLLSKHLQWPMVLSKLGDIRVPSVYHTLFDYTTRQVQCLANI